MIKLKWKVAPVPTGKYASFEKRSWPDCWYENDQPAASLSCPDEYVPSKVKEGNHQAITVRIAFWFPEYSKEHGSFQWKKLMKMFADIKEAKLAAETYVKNHPEIWPPEIRKNKGN